MANTKSATKSTKPATKSAVKPAKPAKPATKSATKVVKAEKSVPAVTTKHHTMYEALVAAKTKKELVEAVTKAGWACKTKPTTTPNTGDLYIQTTDGTHFLFGKTAISIYTGEKPAEELGKFDSELKFTDVSTDGKYRKKKTKISKTEAAFAKMFDWFIANGYELKAETK